MPVLEARGVTKRYGNVEALRGADLRVNEGEVVALVGDNGAGKSTLVKILSGIEQPDGGQVLIDGRPVCIDTPTQARDLGLETVYQDLALAPDLDAAANLFLGREKRRSGLAGVFGFLDKRGMRRESDEIFSRIGVALQDATVPVESLSGGQRQGVAVARAVTWASRILFMDEPTAALGVRQSEMVFNLIRRVTEHGVSVVFISHSMPDVLEVSDRIEVFRLGQRVADLVTRDATTNELVAAMTGASG